MTRPTDEQLRRMGGSLREIDPGALVPDDDGSNVRWFLGDGATELFTWTHAGKPPHHIQLVFARVSAQWDERSGLSTGTFQGEPSTAGGRFDPYLVTMATRIDPDVCRAALTLLQASPLSSEVIGPLVHSLEQALGDRQP